MRTQFTILALTLGVVACKGDASAEGPGSNVIVTVGLDPEQARPPEGFAGTWIEVLPGVEYRYVTVAGVGFQSTRGAWVNGHAFSCEDGWLSIGPQRYGPIAAGAHVQLGADGVFAGGVRLGDLPPRQPMPPDEG